MASNQQVYVIEVRHDGLHKYRAIRGRDWDVVERQARAQLATWDEVWRRRQAVDARRQEREQTSLEKEQKKELAAERTEEAQQALDELKELLKRGEKADSTVRWESLMDRSPFPEPAPPKPAKLVAPTKPARVSGFSQPKFSLLDRLFASRRQRKIEKARERQKVAEERYEEACRQWTVQIDALKIEAARLLNQYRSDVAAWEQRRDAWLRNQELKNAAVDKRRELYDIGDPDAVIDYCDIVLTASQYPEYFPRDWQIDYVFDTKILIVDYSLPDIEYLPKVQEVKYIQSRDEFKETHLPASVTNKLYDDVLYQAALRTIHELFQADVIRAVESIVFNGWVRSIDRRTGQEVNACIMSLQAGREEFIGINLAQVDPKECFRSLKGVASAKLHGLTPIAPILQMNREDKRFIRAYAVADQIQEGDNLAAMDWEDFEHLIRELFEKEFSQAGGEVKVTRASRDGGVDAVVFDPDPIRGGKIVIQAKRYTNVVGVSAVRDLYGTLLNEGANKGILVTTSNYGSDAYAFAKGKPITLLDGANLLHLLEKHGHKARIDLKEAKQMLADQEKNE